MKWISKIKEFASLITAMTVVIGVLWGGFSFMNKTSTQGDALEQIQQQQTMVLDSISSLSRQLQDLGLTVEGINDNTVLIGNYVEGVNKALIFHLQHSSEVTKDDYAAMMQIIEELKKKEQQTVYTHGSTE